MASNIIESMIQRTYATGKSFDDIYNDLVKDISEAVVEKLKSENEETEGEK